MAPPKHLSLKTTFPSQEEFPPLGATLAAAALAQPAEVVKNPPKPLSFAAVVRDKRKGRYADVPLPARQYGTKDGVPSINFSLTEHQALTQRICHTVIAKFQGVRPPLSAIKTHVESNWKIKGSFSMSPNWDGRHVVFMLDSEEDVNAALVCPSRRVHLSFFRLFRWSPDYNPKKESTRVTKWLKLPGLPMEFFTRSCVKAIVSSFAHFLDIDERTSNMNSLHCARACVELDVAGKVPTRVWISIGEHSFFQDVVVEGGIAYCTKCKKHGHEVTSCKKMPKPHIVAPEGKDLAPSDGAKWQNQINKSEQQASSQQNVEESSEIIPSGPTLNIEKQGVIPPTVMEASVSDIQKNAVPIAPDEVGKEGLVRNVSLGKEISVVESHELSMAMVIYEGVTADTSSSHIRSEKTESVPLSSPVEVRKVSVNAPPDYSGPRNLYDIFPFISSYLAEEGILEIPDYVDDPFLDIVNRAIDKYNQSRQAPVVAPGDISPPISEWIPSKSKRRNKGKKITPSDPDSALRRSSRARQSTEAKNSDFIYHSK